MDKYIHEIKVRCRYWVTVIFMAILTLYLSGYTFASPAFESQESLATAARAYLKEYFSSQYELQISAGRLDNRLRLQKCGSDLQVSNPRNNQPIGHVSLAIVCQDPYWKVHLPLQVRAYTKVLVAKRSIARGSTLQESDLTFARHDVSRYYAGVFTQLENLVGMSARRSIRQDAVISARMVKPRLLVTRGQMITIVAESNGLLIRTAGEALMDGHRGQIVKVVNQRSGRKLSGVVIARSTVRVKM